jgi:Flp pilus assembly protein TadB
MLYDKLLDIVVRPDWRLMSVEYEAVAVGAFAVGVVLLWRGVRMRKRMRRIETQLEKMQKEISLLQMQESRRLMTELNMKSTEKIEPPGTARDQRVDTVATGKTD